MAYSYKCPNCSANLVFDADIRRMVCGFCESVISPHDIVSKENDQEGYVMGEQWTDATLYNCGNCNAEVVVGEDALTDTCVYCESPVILTHRLSAGVKPTKIIPFRFGKKQAQDECMKWLKKRKYLPGKFLRRLKVVGLKGIYIPVWLFDYPVDVHVKYDVDYSRNASGFLLWEKVPVDASSHITQDIMERIEPFNYRHMNSFETQYLSGFLAEKPQKKHDELSEQGLARVKKYVLDAVNSALGKDEIKEEWAKSESTIGLYDSSMYYEGKAELALLPVWFINIKYLGKEYTIAMNGQTGATVADLPLSKIRMALTLIILWLLIVIPALFFIVAIWRFYE